MTSQMPIFLTPPGALLNPRFSGPVLAAMNSSSGVATSVTPIGLASAFLISVISIPDQPHPHLRGDHHRDPFAYGVKVGLAFAVLYVGGRMIAGRIFKP
jgi:hypothetical protein